MKGDVKLKDRKEAYDEINEGTNPLLFNHGVEIIGINIPAYLIGTY